MFNKQLHLKLPLSNLQNHSIHTCCETDEVSNNGKLEARGAVTTRPEVADFILDLAGYTHDKPLHEMRILEPSFGAGHFLIAIVTRLLNAWEQSENRDNTLDVLRGAVRAVELHSDTFFTTRREIIELLTGRGFSFKNASYLVDNWLINGDFLLCPIEGVFDFVVGNPPYVRQELIPSFLINEYKSRYETIYDRADLYVPFIERSLSLLSTNGCIGFICADRWTKNRYGQRLRGLVDREFHLKIYVDMVDTPAFNTNVSAYPAIVVISREKSAMTRIAHRPKIDSIELKKLAKALNAKKVSGKHNKITEIPTVSNGSRPWLFESSDNISLIRRLEREYPSIEQAGCKVGIGVATGADKVFIGDFYELDVESDRKLPLVTTKDIQSGVVRWNGKGVINPFSEGKGLVDLQKYPRLRQYLEIRKEMIAKRHCVKKSPEKWFRTIDRIYPSLAKKPKLLIPDIKGSAHVVFEKGELYPHHNLYYITSEEWNLKALQAIMLSNIARFFVAAYSTKMRGGFLRFQAQYIRRIRIPKWTSISTAIKNELILAAEKRDLESCDRVTFKLYKLNHDEIAAIRVNGD